MRLDNTTLSVWTTIIQDSAVVPVELKDFSASVIDNTIYLNWTTATETNNLGFEIERKFVSFEETEGKWEKRGFVAGGNNNGIYSIFLV
jgi:hypothetical protein